MHTLTIKIQSENREFIKEILRALSGFNGNENVRVHTEIETKENNPIKTKVIEMIKQGIPSEKIASQLGLTKYQVAAYKAHMTMGHYQ